MIKIHKLRDWFISKADLIELLAIKEETISGAGYNMKMMKEQCIRLNREVHELKLKYHDTVSHRNRLLDMNFNMEKQLDKEREAWAEEKAGLKEQVQTLTKERDELKKALHHYDNITMSLHRENVKLQEENEWQPVTGWEDYYEVSKTGCIRSIVTKRKVGSWYAGGYEKARLSYPRKEVRVHRIVATSYCCKPEGKDIVNHIDNNPANNAASNLEWVTQAENIRHAARQGRMQNDYWVGKRSPNSNLTDEQVGEVRTLRAMTNMTYQQIAEKVGTNKKTAMDICNGRTYRDVQ